MTLESFCLFLSLGANIGASVVNVALSQRLKRREQKMRTDFEKLLAFAAVMSTEESGSPANVRRAAREALPMGVEIEVGPRSGDDE